MHTNQKNCQMTAKSEEITWQTLTGIQFPELAVVVRYGLWKLGFKNLQEKLENKIRCMIT